MTIPPYRPSPIPTDEPPEHIREEVTVGIVTALPVEFAAMERLLVEARAFRDQNDPNNYRVASLPSADPERSHRVALVRMPQDGTRAAAAVCVDLLRTFPNVRCVVMVGIAGGVPRPTEADKHVRLGDVVVATLGLVDYGHVRQEDGQRILRRHAQGMVSSWLAAAAGDLQVAELRGQRPWEHWLDPAWTAEAAEYKRPGDDSDRLLARGLPVNHPPRTATKHREGAPKIHYGAVASADVLVRDEVARDDLAKQFRELRAIEMEASGIAAGTGAHDIAWFMVRGITDYCDMVGKTDAWHPYASYAAASYVRALLEAAPPAVRALPLVTTPVRDKVIDLLRPLSTVDTRRVWRMAAPDLPDPPSGVLRSPERAFLYLLRLNANAEGLPPAIRFLDGLAGVVEDADIATALYRRADQMAEQNRAGPALVAWRRRFVPEPDDVVPETGPCMIIEIEQDGIDRGSCRIASYIQENSGRWRPRPGPRYQEEVPVAQAEQHVGDLVNQVEQGDWQPDVATVGIEFLMSTGLINLPAEWWRPRSSRGRPMPPLGVDYLVVARSLDRMRDRTRPRVWNSRWTALTSRQAGTAVHWGVHPETNSELDAWEAQLHADPGLTSVVLSTAPDRSPGKDELEVALMAEVPVILWDRRDKPDGSARPAIEDLVSGEPAELPDRTRRLRTAAVTQPRDGDEPSHPGSYVALLWDDPRRTVAPWRESS